MPRKPSPQPPAPARYVIKGGDCDGQACTITETLQRGLVRVLLERYGFHLLMGRDRLMPATK